jgi:hypothetical protein
MRLELGDDVAAGGERVVVMQHRNRSRDAGFAEAELRRLRDRHLQSS